MVNFDRIACGTVTRRALNGIGLNELTVRSNINLPCTQIAHRVFLKKQILSRKNICTLSH